MTVDEHDMDARVRVRRAHNGDSWVDLCWRELPNLTGARRENWMTDRAKNAMGTAKLASVYLDQERGRIGRLRKTKSVLASRKFIGKNLNKRRNRPHPTKPKHPQNQCHRRWREIYGQTLPNNGLPSLPSRNLSHTTGSASASRLPTVSAARRSSREDLIDNGTPKNNYVLHGVSTTPPSANPSLALQTKGDQLRNNLPCISIKVDSHTPYVPGDLVGHNVHHRSKNSLSQPGPSPSSFGPSAIDLFDQCKLLPELAVGLKEEEDRPQPPNCRDTNDCGSEDPDSNKAPAAMDWPASTASAVRSLPLPDCASSDSRGTPCREEDSRYHEIRARNKTTQNRLSSTLEPPTIVKGGSPAYSPLSQYQRSPERCKGAEERIQRGESEKAEDGVLSPRRLNPVSAKTKIPAKSERTRHRDNTSPASPPISLTTATATQNDGGDAKGTSSQQRLVDALAQLQKNKDLDALRSEYVEALSILQKITHPFSATSRTTIDEERQKVNDVAVQVIRVREKNSKKSGFATETSDNDNDSKGNTYTAPDSKSAAMAGVEVIPADEGMETLSTSPPRIDSREQNALRLLYRKWWTRIATGGSVSCLPEPSNFSIDEGSTRPVSQNRRTELVDEGGSKRRDAKIGTDAFVGEEIRRNCFRDGSMTNQKDVAIATEAELPGSIGDATTLFSSSRMLQPSKEKMREERRISSAPETRRSSDVGRRPQVKNECTGRAIYVTPSSPRAVTSGITDDAGHTSHHRKSTRAHNLVSAAGLTQNETTRLSHARTRQTSLGLPMAGEEHYLEYPSNKPNQVSGDVRQGNEEEQTVPRYCQDTTPVTRKDIAVITRAKSLGSLENMTRSPSESPGIQLASVGARPERRRGRARALRSSPNIGCNTQGASAGTKTMNLTASKPSRPCTCDDSHDAGLSSCGRAKENYLTSYSGETLGWKGASGYKGNTPNQVLSEATRSEDILAMQRFSKGSTKTTTRKDIAAHLSLPLITLGATHDVHRMSCFRTKARGRDYNLTANFAQQYSPGYEDNQSDQILSSPSTDKKDDEEQAVLRCSRDVTNVLTRKGVVITTETDSPGSTGDIFRGLLTSIGVQLPLLGMEADEICCSTVRATRSSSDAGDHFHVESGGVEAATSVNLTPFFTTSTWNIPNDPDYTNDGRPRGKVSDDASAAGFVPHEGSGYAGNQSTEALNDTSQGEDEERGVSRWSHNVTKTSTRKYVAITTEADSSAAFLGVQLTSCGIGTDCRRSSSVSATRRRQVASRYTKALTCLTPVSTCTGSATDDPVCTSGRIRARASNNGSIADLAGNVPSECVQNLASQDSSHPSRGKYREQEVLRCPQGNTTITAQNDAESLIDIKRRPSTSPVVALTSAGTGADEIRCSSGKPTGKNSDDGGRPQVGSRDIRAMIAETAVSPSNIIQEVTHDPDHTSRGRVKVRIYDSGSVAGVMGHEFQRSMGNQPSQAYGNARRGKEEKCFPRYSRSQDPTTVTTMRDFRAASKAHSPRSLGDDTGGPFASFEEQTISARLGTDERRRSGARSRGSSLNVSGSRQVASREAEASSSETLLYLSPPTIPRGVPHNANQTSHGRSGARTIETGFARDFARPEPYECTGNQFSQNMSKSGRGGAEEQAVPRCFQDVTSAITRKHAAVTTDAESPGNLGTVGDNLSASLRVKLNTLRPRADEQRRSVVTSSGKSLDFGGVAIEDAEAVTADILVSLSPSITTLDATHDAHQTSRGRARVTAINSSAAADLMLHEPSGYTESGPNKALINAIRMNEEGQDEPRCPQDVTQAFTRKDVAVGTEIKSPGNFGDVTNSTPAFLRVQLTSVGVGTEEGQSSGMGLTWSRLDFGGSPQFARGDPEATASRPLVNLSPPTSPGYSLESSGDASPCRSRSIASDFGSAVDIVEHKPLENPRNQRHHEPNDVSRGKEQEKEVPRCSRDVTTAPKLDKSAFVIEANSPGSLSDMSKSPSAFLGVQFISRGVGTDERRYTSVTSTEINSDVDGRPQVVSRDTRDAKSVTFSYILSPTSTRDDKGLEEDEHTVQRSSDDAATVPKRNDDDVTTKTRSVGSRRDKRGDSSALELQLLLLGEETDEIVCKRSIVQGSSLDVGGCPEVASKDAEATVSVILVSPHTSTRGTTDGPQNTTCAHTTAKTFVGLAVDHAPHVPLGYSSNQPNQASCYASRTKEEEDVAPSCSQDITAAMTTNHLGFVTDVESPGSLGDVTGSLSASPGVQLTSVGVNTDERRRSSSATATSVTMATSSKITHGETHNAHYTTYDRTRARHISIGSAANLTPDSHTGRDRRKRAKALSLDSAAGVEQHEPLVYKGKKPNRALFGVQQWNGREQAVQRCPQDVSTVPTRFDITTSTEENLGNIMRSPSTSLRIQPTPAGQDVDERCRSEVSSKERSLDVEVHPLSTCENIGAMIYSPPVSPPTSTRDVMVDATITSSGSSIAFAISSDSAVSFARHKPSRYTGNPPNQASRDSRRGTEGKEAMPKCSNEITAANNQRDEADGIETESPESFGDVTGDFSASPGVKLTSVGVNTDEHRRCASTVVTSVTMVAPSTITRGDTHDAHYTTYGRTKVRPVSVAADLAPDSHTGRGRRRRARALSLDSAAGVEQHEPLTYTGKKSNRALIGVQQWKGGEQAVQRCLQDISTVPTRIDVATSTKENLGNIMRSPSTPPRIQSTPAGQRVDERRRSEVSSKGRSLGVEVHPISTCENIEATISSTPVSPPTSTRDVMVDATITSCGRPIASAISTDSAVGFARRKPSRYTGSPPNQASSDSRRGTEGKEPVPKCSNEVTAANKQRDEAVGTGAESPESLDDVTGSFYASPGIKLTSAEVNTDEHRRSGSAVAASLTMVAPSIITRGDTHDAHYTTSGRTRARHVSIGSAANLTPDSHTGRGRRRRAKALSLDSAAGVEQHEPLAFTGKKSNRALIGVQQWNGGERAVQRCLQDVSTVPTRIDVATSTKENLGDIMRSPSTSPRMQPTSADQGVNERNRSEVSSKGRGLGVEVHPLSTCENIEATISSTPVSPPTSTRDVMVDATITSCDRSIASAVSTDSAVSFARSKPSRYTGSQPNQASSDSRRGTEGKEAVPKCFKEVTVANNQRDDAVGTEAESPESFGDVTRSSSAFPGVKLTSVGVNTVERRRSGSAVETSLTMVAPSIIIRGGTDDAHYTISDRTRARHVSLDSAVDLTPDSHTGRGRRRRARALSLDSAAGVEQHEPLAYTGKKPNRALIGVEQWKGGEQAVQRCLQDISTVPTRIDVATSTKENLGDIMRSPSISPRIQSTPAGQRVDERRRSEVSSKGRSLGVEVHPLSTCENIEATISSTPVSPPTSTRDVMVDATITSCGRSIASAISLDSAVSFARHKPSRLTGNPRNQASSDSRRGTEGEEAMPKCSKEVTAANKQRGEAVGTETESPESLGDVTGSSSASAGVQLTSRGETGEIRRRGTEAETPITLASSSTTTRSATLDAHHTVPDRTRARVVSFGSATDLTREGHISHCHRTRAKALSLDSATCVTLDGYLGYTDKPKQTLNDARRWKEEEQTALRFYLGRTTAPTLKDIAVETETKAPSDNLSDIQGDSSSQLISVKTWVDKKRRRGVRVAGDSSNICGSPRVESGDAKATTCISLVYRSPPNIFSSASHEADQTSHGRKRARAIDSVLPVDFVQCESLRYIGYQADQPSTYGRWHNDVQAMPRCSHNATTAATKKDVIVITKADLPGSPGAIKLDPSASSGVQLTSLRAGTNESRRSDLSATESSSNLGGRLQSTSEGIGATVSVIPVSQPVNTRNTKTEPEHSSLGRTRASAINFVPAADSVRENPLRFMNISSEHALNYATRGKEDEKVVPRCFQESATINNRRDIAGANEARSSGSLGGVMRDRYVFPGEQLTSVEAGTDERRRSDLSTTGRSSEVDNHPRDVSGGTQDATDDPDHTSGGCKRARAFNCESIADLTEYEPLRYTDIQPNQTLGKASRETYVEHTMPRWPQSTIAATKRKDIAATTETEYPGRFGGIAGNKFVSHTVQLTLEGLGTGKRRRGYAAVSTSSVTPVSPPIIAHGTIHDAHSNTYGRTRASTSNVGSAVALVREDHTYHCCSTRGEPSSLDSAIGVIRKGSSRYTDNQSNQVSNDARIWNGVKNTVQRFPQDSTPAPTWKEFDIETKTESPGSLDDISERPFASSAVQLTSVGAGMDEISHRGASVTRNISPVGRLAHLATEGTGVVTSATLVHDSLVMNRGASQDGHYNSRNQNKACAIIQDLRTGSEQDNPSRYRCNQLIQTSDASRGKYQGHMVSWFPEDITTVHQQRVITIATGEEPSGSFGDIEDNFPASLGATLSSVRIETGETWRGDVRALGRSSTAGRRPQGGGESTELADSRTLQLPSIIIHDASYDAHHTSVSQTRVSARSHSCGARMAGRRSDSDRHLQGMSEGINVTLSPPPAIIYNATNDIYETSCGFRETSAGGRGSPASLEERKYFERYTGNRPIQVLSDSRQEKQDTSTGTTRRYIAITAQTEPPRDIGDVLGEGSPSLGAHLTSIEIGTDKSRPSAVMATERSLSVRRRPRVMVGDAEAETSMNLTYLSPPIIIRDATSDVHQNSHGRKRARDANFDPAVTPYKPSGYAESRPNSDFSITCRSEEGKQGVRRYSQDVTAASTRKYVSIAGKTESPRKLRGATSFTPISSPTRTCRDTVHAGYSNHTRPATQGHASGATMGLGEGKPCGVLDDQILSGASEKKKGKHGVAKVDVDEDYVSEEDCLVTGEEEEGIYGRVYLPDGKFTTLLGLDPDRNCEDEDEVPIEDGVISEISWQETAKWNHGEDAKSLEYDDDDFEEL